MSLNAILEELRGDVTDFVAVGVVHREEGIAIASVQVDETDVDVAAAEAYLAEMLRQHLYAQSNLEREADTEDLLVSTGRGLAIGRPIPDSDYLWTLVAGPGANPTLTRALMRKFHGRVSSALAEDTDGTSDDEA